MKFTNTNTDALCFDDIDNDVRNGDERNIAQKSRSKIRRGRSWWRLAVYRYNLWTGLYMLDMTERRFINTVCGILAIATTWCGAVFWRGFYAGWIGAAAM